MMKAYKVSVSDDKVVFFKQLLDNLNIDYSADLGIKKTSVKVQKENVPSIVPSKVHSKTSEQILANKKKGILEDQQNLQEVLKKLEQMRR